MNQDPGAPAADVRPVRITVGGIEYDDPYTWLEEESVETHAWQAMQNAFAERVLRDVEGFEELRRQLNDHIGSTFVSAPHGCGDCWIRLAHGAGGERLERAADPAGPWRSILAIEDFSRPDGTASLDWFFPSRMVTTWRSVSLGAATSSASFASWTWSERRSCPSACRTRGSRGSPGCPIRVGSTSPRVPSSWTSLATSRSWRRATRSRCGVLGRWIFTQPRG